MTLIRNANQIKQAIDFTGIKNGLIHPTDIDAVLEFDNEAIIFIEVKRKGNTLPIGQRLLLERLTKNWKTKKAIALFLTHTNYNSNELIDLKNCELNKYYRNGKWETPKKEYTLAEILNKLGVAWNIKKLKI